MTYSGNGKFSLICAAALGGLLLLTGCPPAEVSEKAQAGEFLASRTKMFDTDSEFDLKWKVVYPELVKGGSMPDPSLNVSNKQLFINRCLWCHECGAPEAFDWENYGTEKWSPKYIGEQWAIPVQRMRDKSNSFLNEQIAERIFVYLRDDTLGVYEEEEDDAGAVTREVDEETYRKLQAEQAGAVPAAPPTEGEAETGETAPESGGESAPEEEPDPAEEAGQAGGETPTEDA